jgi:RND family efflux transporter MFP subunit
MNVISRPTRFHPSDKGAKLMDTRFVPQILLAGLGAMLMIWSLAADAQEGPPPAPVEVAEAETLSMAATVMAPGTIVSRNDAAVAAEVPGSLRAVAEVGDRVAAGDVIAAIDDSDLQLQLRYADATIRRLEASLKYLNSQLDRQRKLASQNIAARNELDETESQRDMTGQELVQARIAREQTQLLIEKSRVRAPFAGRIVERYRDAGEYISVGGELVRLVDMDNIEVRAQAPMSVARFLSEGAEVVIRDSDRQTLSTIRTVIPVGDERSRMIEVRIDLAEPGWVIGAAVRVALPETEPVAVVAVPRDALILRQNATYVYKLNGDSTVEQIVVSTGIGNGAMIEVKGDIAAGDRIVIRGGERLQPGQAVAVAEGRRREKAREDDVKLARQG